MTELQRLALGTIPTVCKVPPKKEQEEAFLAQPIMIKGATFSSNDATGDKEAKQDILSDWINYYYRQRNVHMKYKSPNVYEKDDGDDGDETKQKPYGPPSPPTEEEKQKMLEEYRKEKNAIIEQIRSKNQVEKCLYDIKLKEVYPLNYNPNSTDSVQVWVEENTVKIKYFVCYKDDLNDQIETEGFLGLGKKKCHLWSLFQEGVEKYWTTEINGTPYDFWPEFKGKIEVEVIQKNPTAGSTENKEFNELQKFVSVSFDNSKYAERPSHTSFNYINESGERVYEWSIQSDKSIKMCTNPYGKKDEIYSAEYFERVAAHETGHVFGIDDAYLAFIIDNEKNIWVITMKCRKIIPASIWGGKRVT